MKVKRTREYLTPEDELQVRQVPRPGLPCLS
jgi:hypothetical protein